ncbi:PREDICTED: electron transfer flavoprotein-ubiquinone oxidoreductase, mitochondrial-like isoform X2 [Wasmannia auropunctata]|uniref:electron transfer flavoprotein-ubiquinone oxidoreductase, mitochondrial-like isoform X2 n=1 Tax=Wasmannia auropunctata TaxID=64793 RepID=UPI0005ED7534|nr:PREDICTED: electron transfer flavoprotein-ubiquinone oxidoreductase, mitochondrial-like isoform X2 [Wasmannia auropunctata]
MEKYVYETDILIVGGGLAGLSAAIQARRLAEKHGKELRVTLVERWEKKGYSVCYGANNACLNPIALNELFPNWKELNAPLNTPVTEDKFVFLTEKRKISIPIFKRMPMSNHGNYIAILSDVVMWLVEQAEAAGVEICYNRSAIKVLFHEDGSVKGVQTEYFSDFEIDLSSSVDLIPSCTYRDFHARCTIFASGSPLDNHLMEDLSKKFNLSKDCKPQTYCHVSKEVWEIEPSKHRPGVVEHTVGWPLERGAYGEAYFYHLNEETPQIATGFFMQYNTFYALEKEFKKIKQHPGIRPIFEGGKNISNYYTYESSLEQGGFQSIPKLQFPGGCLTGSTASFITVPQFKGTHHAMKSGMLAAESVIEAIIDAESNTSPTKGLEPKTYTDKVKNSWIYKELKAAEGSRGLCLTLTHRSKNEGSKHGGKK